MPVYFDRYLREERLNARTGGILALYDTAAPVSCHPAGERWLVLCVAHDTETRFSRLAQARRALAHPEEHCADCAALVRAQDDVAADPASATLAPHERGARVIARATVLLGRPLADR